MATGGGKEHKRAATRIGPLWEHPTDFSVFPERNLRGKVPIKVRKNGATLASSASAHDLRHSEMDKERQDISSPRGVIEACLESNSDYLEDSSSGLQAHCSSSRTVSHWTRFFKLWKRKSLKHLSSLTPLPVPNMSKHKSRSTKESKELRDLYGLKSTLANFTLADLQNATKNFSCENLIGRGGFAEVYRGCFSNGKLVAVKRLMKGTADEKTTCFLSELGIMAHVDHPNIAKLLGCGIEGGMHLVFELSPLGSLRSVLHDSDVKLDWSKRYKIALGTADGLLYLHETCRRRIIHRDIKADNILLTEDFVPQICDFGLAKWLPTNWTHHNVSKFEGTFGYFAPEYFMHGVVDEKTDIFAFGVLLLELITGRRALDHLQQSLVIWAKPLLGNNDIKELADPSLGDNYDKEEMDRMVLTASLCVEQSSILRPRISQAVILLRGEDYVLDCVKQCQRRSLQRTFSEEILDVHEYNSTKCLNDVDRLKENALAS